jgi:hypothetical protein
MTNEQDEVQARRQAAAKGWLTDTPPPPPRDVRPGEEHKWPRMMGVAHLAPGGAGLPAAENSSADRTTTK